MQAFKSRVKEVASDTGLKDVEPGFPGNFKRGANFGGNEPNSAMLAKMPIDSESSSLSLL